MEPTRFDDLDALRALASDAFGDFGPRTEVTQQMIDAFAELTGDRQWIHVDVERATRESPFGGPIAHGFLTLSLLPKMAAGASLQVTGHTNAVNYGAESLRFLSPVPSRGEHPRPQPSRAGGGEVQRNARDRRVGHPCRRRREARRALPDADALPVTRHLPIVLGLAKEPGPT